MALADPHMSTDTHLLIKLAHPFDVTGSLRTLNARRDRIYIVHNDEEIDVSHLCQSWAASATVNDLRTATVQFILPRIVEGDQ